MTRKEFIAVAAIINKERALRDEGRLDRISKALADLFEDRCQGRFDYGRFLKACGVTEDESIEDQTKTK